MLTPTGRTIAAGAVLFGVGGLAFGNWPVFGASALLAMLLAFASLAKPPRVERVVERARIERGGRFRVRLDVHVPRGLGIVEVHQALPEEFELVEGNNLHVLTFGLTRRVERLELVARAPKRGEFELPPVGLKVLHPLGFLTTPTLRVGESVTLHVEPRPLAASIPRDTRARAKRPFPEGDLARLGVATNDFRELREYVPGDPPRRINWKATARRIGSGASEVPLVNETEWEGKKMVWILVDGHARLSVGTNLEDAREHAADAALSLVEVYLRRGYQVGVALARSGPVPALLPGTGESQVRRARELLARLQPAESPTLSETLDRDAGILHRGKPLVILVTRLAGADEDLYACLRRVGALGRMHGRGLVPGLVVDVEPDPAKRSRSLAEQAALVALENDRVRARAAARASGMRVTQWRAGSEPLQSILTRGRIA